MDSTAVRSDQALDHLAEAMLESIAKMPDIHRLWLVDDHPLETSLLERIQGSRMTMVTNRVDQQALASSLGIEAVFSDFDLSGFNPTPSEVFVRIPKERALMHHLINQAFTVLTPGGILWLCGYKNEGIKTCLKKAAELFGGSGHLSRGKNQLLLARLTKTSHSGPRLDDQEYLEFREIVCAEDEVYWTKPGIYGWNKIDNGSQLLTQCLAEHCCPASRESVLDLGSGYGFLSCFAATRAARKLVATDNCHAALEATRRNLKIHEDCLEISVEASNAGDAIDGPFDLILCNPPFHRGFSIESQLHERFLTQTRRLLGLNGEAWYVVNQFLALENHCSRLGLTWELVTRSSGFKVLRIRR